MNNNKTLVVKVLFYHTHTHVTWSNITLTSIYRSLAALGGRFAWLGQKVKIAIAVAPTGSGDFGPRIFRLNCHVISAW